MTETTSLAKPTAREAIDGAAVVVFVGIALASFRSAFGGSEFLILGVAATVVGVAIAFLMHRKKLPLIVGIAAVFGVYVVIGGAAALHSRATAGFLPSLGTLTASLRMVVSGWKELVTTAPPVGRTGDLMVLPFLLGISAGFASYTVARRLRRSAPVLLAPTVTLVLGILTGTTKPVSLILNGAVFASLAVAWLAWRDHGRQPLLEGSHHSRGQIIKGAAVLAAAGALGALLAPLLPFAPHRAAKTNISGADPRTILRPVNPPFDPSQYPSPLAQYRHYVKETNVKNQVMFSITGLPMGIPVRLATMDQYDDLVWKVSAGALGAERLEDSGAFQRVGSELAPEFSGPTATVAVTIGKYNDVWIPDVGEVISLEFKGSAKGAERDRLLAEAFRYNITTDTAASRVPLIEGDRYVMKVRLPAAADNMAGKTLLPNAVRLPESKPVTIISQKIVGPDILGIKDSGEQLDAVRKLMTESTYSDGDKNSGQIKALAGHSAYRLNQFVSAYPKRPLIGNAEQYAAAYALLFRGLNVQTRVVMGFRPSKDSTSTAVEVTAKEVEAWVEVPVKDSGWIAIFPTPDRSHTALTSSSEQQPEPDYRTQNPPPPPVLDPEFDQPATAAGKAKSTKAPTDQNKKAAPDPVAPFVSTKVLVGAAIGSSPFILAGIAGGTIMMLKRRRRRRRRSDGLPHERIANGWREVTDLAVDMGRAVPDATTRREAAAFVGSGTTSLAVRADASVWDVGEPTDEAVEQYWGELTATLKAMRSELGLVDRLKSSVSVQSLRRRERAIERDRGKK
jgi:hypothetical protein